MSWRNTASCHNTVSWLTPNRVITLCHDVTPHRVITLCHDVTPHRVITLCHGVTPHRVITLCHDVTPHRVITLCHAVTPHRVVTLCHDVTLHRVITLCHIGTPCHSRIPFAPSKCKSQALLLQPASSALARTWKVNSRMNWVGAECWCGAHSNMLAHKIYVFRIKNKKYTKNNE